MMQYILMFLACMQLRKQRAGNEGRSTEPVLLAAGDGKYDIEQPLYKVSHLNFVGTMGCVVCVGGICSAFIPAENEPVVSYMSMLFSTILVLGGFPFACTYIEQRHRLQRKSVKEVPGNALTTGLIKAAD
jgi:hypothetical protein